MHVFAILHFGYGIRYKEQPVLHDLFADADRGEVDVNAVADDAAADIIIIIDGAHASGLASLQRVTWH